VSEAERVNHPKNGNSNGRFWHVSAESADNPFETLKPKSGYGKPEYTEGKSCLHGV